MNSTQINITFKKINGIIPLKRKYIKGSSTVSYSFTNMNESVYRVNSLTIKWGDGTENLVRKRNIFFDYRTESIFEEVENGKIGGTLLASYSHDYYNNYNNYGADFYTQIILEWEDGAFTYIIQPLTILYDSFYDSVKEINVLSTQILPVTSNKTFINLETKDDITTYIGVLDTKGVELSSSNNVRPIFLPEPLGFEDTGFLATSNFLDILWPTSDGEKFISVTVGYSVL